MTATETPHRVRAGSLDDVREKGVVVVAAEGRTIAVFNVDGDLFALDNRCPHMGFPLSRGTVKDGILTCHWHHAKFELSGGCAFDLFADDVPSFPVEVRDGQVWIDVTPGSEDRTGRWLGKLTDGLEQNIRLVVAKAVIGLSESGSEPELLRQAASFGIRNNSEGWSAGMSILTAMATVRPSLAPADRPRALYHGVSHIARSVAGKPPAFDLAPLDSPERRHHVFREWFRRFIETRSGDAAERCLLTAIRAGLSPAQLADMLFAAGTDHLFLDDGHSVDFINKACELLDLIGWDRAAEVLPSLIPNLVDARRMEETSQWQHPVDLPDVLAATFADFQSAIEAGAGKLAGWDGHRALAAMILDAEPADSLRAIVDAARSGVPLTELSGTVAYAAALRPAYFHISNEFGDWDTVHHTFTYTNAVDQGMRRAPSVELARGILDGAMSVYLERFLNVPRQPLPRPSGKTPPIEALYAEFDQQQHVDETAQIVADLLATGRHEEVIQGLGHALLREDAGFHEFQIYEAALRQYRNFAGRPEGDHILIGAARFLTAHAPTVRSWNQTFEIAARLNRGEALYEGQAV